jgi:dihydrofolate synthase/folylpolyglutamate synthase
MATKMQIDDALSWLYSYSKYGSKLGLERITDLLNLLNNPHHRLQAIHVTGTNGKGSVCRFLGSILTHAGYKTGIYLSPHLERFSERMLINGKEISHEELIQLVQQIKPVVIRLEKKGFIPTFFEIITAMAFSYFYQQKVDYVVVEVGLGGRFDATNVIQPLLSIITNISLEHTQYLGDDVTSVAYEKAGIIKSDAPVVTAAENEALLVIEAVAKEKLVSIVNVTSDKWKRLNYSLESQQFIVKGKLKDYQVHTSILGEYQGQNLAVTIHALEQLQLMGIFISDTDIIEGISTTVNPGRMEILSYEPIVLLDGAHNSAGMNMLVTSLKNDFSFNNLIMIVGILKDKNIEEMLKSLIEIAHIIIFTQSENPRASEPEHLASIASNCGFKGKIMMEPSLEKAIITAFEKVNKKDIVCISGSLFTVGEARTLFLKKKDIFSGTFIKK